MTLALKPRGSDPHGSRWSDGLYSDQPQHQYRIDFTTNYTTGKQTPGLVCDYAADAKLICISRHPVDRFVPHYYQYRKMGIAMPKIESLINDRPAYATFMFSFANYKETVDRYEALLGTKKICFLRFEGLRDDPRRVERELPNFLGLGDFPYVPTESDKNKSGLPKNQFRQRALFSDTVKRITHFVPISLESRLLQTRKKVVLLNTKVQTHVRLKGADFDRLSTHLAPQVRYDQPPTR